MLKKMIYNHILITALNGVLLAVKAQTGLRLTLPEMIDILSFDSPEAQILHLKFENELLQGLDTMIGETGRNLSGGQKQRLLIARALYRNPKFLFLDEATNALDAINEQKIVEALKRASVGRTVVIIAHRLSTVRHADQIIVLNKGFLAEVGTHESLMAKNALYASLVASQMYIQT